MIDRRAESPSSSSVTGTVRFETSPPLRPPLARGPLSAWVFDRLGAQRYNGNSSPAARDDLVRAEGRGLGEDAQLAVCLCYESHSTSCRPAPCSSATSCRCPASTADGGARWWVTWRCSR